MSHIQLYQPHKYKVFIGENTQLSGSIGFCTCWSDPEILLRQNKELLHAYALIGTLYSKEGVSIIVRNLALNPHITAIVIWANSSLSQTAIGASGRQLLMDVWQGRALENLHKEIPKEALQKIITRVQLVDASHESIHHLPRVATKLMTKLKKPYMKPQSFPEPQRSEMSIMPSESVGWTVHAPTVTHAWLKVVDRIMRYGAEKNSEYGSSQKELQAITWVVEQEDVNNFHELDLPDNLKNDIGLSKDMREQYKHILLSKEKPATATYTYGSRLHDYPKHIDQIAYIIEKIKESHVTRRAFATTYYPQLDTQHSSPPCLTQVQMLVDINGHVNLFASFRSHDIFKAAISNAFGLLCLQKHIVDKIRMTGLHIGSLTIQSVSAHIYEEDWNKALNVLKCQLWSNIKPYFDEKVDLDPRGYVRIRLDRQKISMELVDQAGEVLYSDQGSNGRVLAIKFAKYDLLAKPDHYCDVAIELIKAEIALKSSIPYIQDRPLVFNGIAVK